MSFARASLAAVLLGTVGCATMRPLRDPAQFITRNHPRVVYITYLDTSGPRTVPRIRQGSPVAPAEMSAPLRYSGAPGTKNGPSTVDSVAVPLHDLAVVQAPQRDATSIILFVSWIAASAAVAAYGYNPAARP